MNKIANVAQKKNEIKPVLAGVLFRAGKIVATDSFKLVELSDQTTYELDAIIPARYLRAGDTIQPDGNIKRKDGSIITPENVLPGKEFPNYEQLMPSENDLDNHYESIRLDRDHLIALLEAMQGEHIRLYVPKQSRVKAQYRAVFIKGVDRNHYQDRKNDHGIRMNKDGNARGLLMPVLE